mgnify:CR=1 FL=1
MTEKQKYYITTAIAYASAKPHIGNTYEIVMADAIARYKRQRGYDVLFQTGTDEHGQKIEEKAKAAGMEPQAYVDIQAAEIKRIWDLMDTSYDRFIRTTDKYHEAQVQKIFKRFYDQGDIYKSEYEGWYCTPCESFWTDSQLVDGKCPDCGREVHREKEESYFFRMSKYAPQLIKYIEEHPEFIQPESRKNEMLNNFLKPGLQDLCVSRTSFRWGIPVTFDPKHVVYVWIDALSNYITGIGYDADGHSSAQFERYWPADLHLIGKDIIRFHTIYWPIMLLALGLPLPRQVFGHPWMLTGADKMSKSRGNIIYADDLVNHFGIDAVRYFVLHEMPFGQDGTITWDLVIERTNSDLANILGNLVKRTLTMSNKYFGGHIGAAATAQPLDEQLQADIAACVIRYEQKMDELRIADALEAIFDLIRRCNKYIDETMPWSLDKDPANRDRLDTVLYNLMEGIRIGAVLLEPFMPHTAAVIYAQLATAQTSYESVHAFGRLEKDHDVTHEPVTLFARIDQDKMMQQLKDEGLVRDPDAVPAPAATVFKPQVVIDDFAKMDIRVGQVLECVKVAKTDKLLQFRIRIGTDERTIVSGIAQFYKPEQLVGKKVLVLANLKPRKVAGIVSDGMILSAEDDAGGLEVVSVGGVADGAAVH